jgi:hypothetical protein
MFIFAKINNRVSSYEAFEDEVFIAWLKGIALTASHAGIEKAVWFASGLPDEAGVDGKTWISLEAWHQLTEQNFWDDPTWKPMLFNA